MKPTIRLLLDVVVSPESGGIVCVFVIACLVPRIFEMLGAQVMSWLREDPKWVFGAVAAAPVTAVGLLYSQVVKPMLLPEDASHRRQLVCWPEYAAFRRTCWIGLLYPVAGALGKIVLLALAMQGNLGVWWTATGLLSLTVMWTIGALTLAMAGFRLPAILAGGE